MRALLLVLVCAAGCNDRGLPAPGGGDGGGGVDGAATDLATADLTSAHDLAGANACVAAGGYCQMGDLVKPTCKSGTHEDTSIEQANPQVCGLGICCVPDTGADCRTTGCASGASCQGCLTPTGVDYVCISDGAAC